MNVIINEFHKHSLQIFNNDNNNINIINNNHSIFNNNSNTFNNYPTTAATPNTTLNTTTCVKSNITDQEYRINAAITLLFSIVVIFGNGIIILVFAFDKTVRTLNNRAVILLAITDFLRGILMNLSVKCSFHRHSEILCKICVEVQKFMTS